MEGSVHTEQELLNEIRTLKAHVCELEQRDKERQQREKEQQPQFLKEHEQREKLEREVQFLHTRDEHTSLTLIEEQDLALGVVFETITDAIAVFGPNGEFRRSNAAFNHLFGVDRVPEYVYLPLSERGSILHLYDLQGVPLSLERWPLQRVLQGEMITSDEFVDIMIMAIDGRQIFIDVSGAPIYDHTGAIVGAVLVFHDITERRKLVQRTTEILQALLAMAEALVQGIDQDTTNEASLLSKLHPGLQNIVKLGQHILHFQHIGILLFDAETERVQPVMVAVESEEISRWQERLADMRLDEYFHDATVLQRLLAGEPVNIDIVEGLDKEKRHLYFLAPMLLEARLSGLMLLDYGPCVSTLTNEERAFMLAFSKLVTLVLERERLFQERSQAQANELALFEANRRMDEFLSIASHELRTPLTTINGNIQLAKRRMLTLVSEEGNSTNITLIQELLSRAERQVRIQNRLVGDLLDVSRIQANRLELHMRASNLITIVCEAVEDQRSAAPGRTILLYNAAEEQAIPAFVDADRIGQVVTNFLTNALKYSAADRPVDVRITIDAHAVRVAVCDEGPGIALSDQQRLWERFYRVPGIVVQSGSGVGLGLGLHICRTIVERHGGDVGVVSELGKGSTFWFSLPIWQPAAARFEEN